MSETFKDDEKVNLRGDPQPSSDVVADPEGLSSAQS